MGDCPDSAFASLHKSTDILDDCLCNSFSHFALSEEAHSQPQTLVLHNSVQIVSAASLPSSTHLSEDQQVRLQDLVGEFQDFFTNNIAKLASSDPPLQVRHFIDTKDSQPVRQRPYNLSHYEMEFLKEEVGKLLSNGLIRPSKSAWLSPVVLVKKKDNSLRLCIEFRALNKVTVLDAYPLPRIESHFSKMAGCRYFTSLDILSAFWQVPMEDSDVSKTAFCTPFGNFRWLRMPFGLVNATATFQRLMDSTLSHCQAFTFQYVDDIIIYDKNFDEHLTHLRLVLLALCEAGLRVNFSKTVFAASSLVALGRVVSEVGVSRIQIR